MSKGQVLLTETWQGQGRAAAITETHTRRQQAQAMCVNIPGGWEQDISLQKQLGTSTLPTENRDSATRGSTGSG